MNSTFHTNGTNTYSNIGVDLMPHGLAMLLELVGRENFVFEKKVTKLNFQHLFL